MKHLAPFLRMLAVAIVTTALIIMGLTIAFNGHTKDTDKLARDTLHAVQAEACELALPVTKNGRDPALVQLCFTQYGLQPPILHNI